MCKLGQQGAVVGLCLLQGSFRGAVTLTALGPSVQWVMNGPPFVTINQQPKPINCQIRDEDVSVRMTEWPSVRTPEALCSLGADSYGRSFQTSFFVIFGEFWVVINMVINEYEHVSLLLFCPFTLECRKKAPENLFFARSCDVVVCSSYL